MPKRTKRLTIEERDELLSYAWLNQVEFARILEVGEYTLSSRLARGEYKELYIMIGASRKFNTNKVKKFLGLTT